MERPGASESAAGASARAEKIFHFVKRLGDTGLPRPLKSGGDIIAERTACVRAMNMVSCDMSKSPFIPVSAKTKSISR